MGVNLHDNDLVPIDATPAERDTIVARVQARARRDRPHRADGDDQPVHRSRVQGRCVHVQRRRASATTPCRRRCAAIDLGVELGAKVYVFWGGREGAETDAGKSPLDALKRFRDALNFLTEYVRDQKLRPRVRARGQAERAARRHLPADDGRDARVHRDARSPRDGRRQPRGRARAHGRPQLPARGRAGVGRRQAVSHRSERPGVRPLRSGLPVRSHSLKQAFFLVKFLEDVGYAGSRHFDAHAYRTEDLDGVRAFARGCMRSYLAAEGAGAPMERGSRDPGAGRGDRRTAGGGVASGALRPRSRRRHSRRRRSIALPSAARGLAYERLDQLTVECLLGVRG